MFRIKCLVVVGFLCMQAVPTTVDAQTSIRGQLYSSLYVSENLSGDQLWDSYHGVRFDAAPTTDRNVRLKGNLRLTRRGNPEDWSEKVYNLYGSWRSADRRVSARVGRQFLYQGVINGSVDGARFLAKPAENLEVGVIAGLAVPIDRSLDVRSWKDAGTLGGFSSYRFNAQTKAELSYVQRQSMDAVGWRQLGASVAGSFSQGLFYNGQLYYNLEKSDVQTGRLRLMYIVSQWTGSLEFNHQLPRIFEDSYFNVFEIEAFDQLRGGIRYGFGQYAVGAQFVHTAFAEDESSDDVLISVESPWGTVGTALQSGYGGDRTGFFGEVRYEVFPDFTLLAKSSYFSYERRNVVIEEDATAVSGGFRYRPSRPWILQAELQQSANSYLDSDVRGLVRVQYGFDLSSR